MEVCLSLNKIKKLNEKVALDVHFPQVDMIL